jgi:hypothetical protein
VNIMSDWWVEAANHTCGDFDRGVDEASLSGLSLLPSERVRAATAWILPSPSGAEVVLAG